MDEKTFPNGRHRNKTYLHVFENDKEFCQLVLKGEKNRFIPEDFLQYLLSKNMKPPDNDDNELVKERSVKYFLKGLKSEMKIELFKIIDQCDEDVLKKQIHQSCLDPSPNSFFGIFYKFFIQKHIGNVSNTNCYSGFINRYLSIFPFPVSDKLSIADFEDGGILTLIKNDEMFTNEMQSFLNKHFDQVDLCSILDTFFANVLNCRANVVDERTIWNVLRNANLTEVLNEAKNTSTENTIIRSKQRNDYLANNYPRFNNNGIQRYQIMYSLFRDICDLYEKPGEILSDQCVEKNYLRKLPEINFYEMYSLLDSMVFNDQPSVYLYRLKKYLFFFVNALNNESKPVFFIDDVLFKSLLHYTTFKKPSRSIDVLDLKYELSLLSLVYSRKLHLHEIPNRFDPNEENLRLVKRYFDRFSDLDVVSIGRSIRTEILDADVRICTNKIVMDVCYKHKPRDGIRDFLAVLLQGALVDENIERLIIINAYLGQETSIEMPKSKQRVIDFIRKYNGFDFSKEMAPEKFLTWGHEEFYEGDVANWDSKIGFNF